MLGWVLSGSSVGPQRVLSEYSGYSWVLRLFIFEYSGGSQVGTSPRTAVLWSTGSICLTLAAQPFLSLASDSSSSTELYSSASISSDLLLLPVTKSCIAVAIVPTLHSRTST